MAVAISILIEMYKVRQSYYIDLRDQGGFEAVFHMKYPLKQLCFFVLSINHPHHFVVAYFVHIVIFFFLSETQVFSLINHHNIQISENYETSNQTTLRDDCIMKETRIFVHSYILYILLDSRFCLEMGREMGCHICFSPYMQHLPRMETIQNKFRIGYKIPISSHCLHISLSIS